MLTPEDVALVRASFDEVAPIKDTVADLFYDRLFVIAPEVEAAWTKVYGVLAATMQAGAAAASATEAAE
jgi:hemoglobin-like flavoprotein